MNGIGILGWYEGTTHAERVATASGTTNESLDPGLQYELDKAKKYRDTVNKVVKSIENETITRPDDAPTVWQEAIQYAIGLGVLHVDNGDLFVNEETFVTFKNCVLALL
jgi:hypothetical protein